MVVHSNIAKLVSAIRSVRRPVVVCAHRGNPAEAPENTLAAISSAITVGADAVEFDVQLSSDGHLMVIHDETCRRTGRHPGTVRDMTLRELKAIDVGRWFAKKFAGEKIPTLEEVIHLCQGRIILVIEVKSPVEDIEPLCNVLIPMIQKYQLVQWSCVVSFYPDILLAIHKHEPALQLGILLNKPELFREMLARPEFQGIAPRYDLLTPTRMTEIRRLGKWVCTWTIDSTQLLRKVMKRGGIDIIATNAPRQLIQALDKHR